MENLPKPKSSSSISSHNLEGKSYISDYAIETPYVCTWKDIQSLYIGMKGNLFSRKRSKPQHRLLRAATLAPSLDLSISGFIHPQIYPSLENLAWPRAPVGAETSWPSRPSSSGITATPICNSAPFSGFPKYTSYLPSISTYSILSDVQFGIYLYTAVRFNISLTEKKSEEDEERVMKNARGFQPSHWGNSSAPMSNHHHFHKQGAVSWWMRTNKSLYFARKSGTEDRNITMFGMTFSLKSLGF